ncbi:WXG100 family type VII secretion target [Streptomyces sp. NPDC058255]|uniref:WXG100 family type VII secretion target n=1 Tax=Streptomyces sp. NPDC058255 TaxID=3346407 RepID=UPI0036E42CF7
MAEPDLTVDYEFLSESERKLSQLQRTFKDIENRRDDMRGHWGSSAIADAMGDFVDNWDDYRTKLIEGIESVGKLVAGTRKAFEELDDELSKRDEKKPKK